jgi:hypothetical protein
MRTGKTRILNLAEWLWRILAAIAFSACAMQPTMQASAAAPSNGVKMIAPYRQLATGGDLALRAQVSNIFSSPNAIGAMATDRIGA